MKKITAYLWEVGVIVDSDYPDYDYYKNAWDRKHGYYDEDKGIAKTRKEAEEIVNKYVEEGSPTTYGLVSQQSIAWDDYEVDADNIDYSAESVVYSVYKNQNGTIIHDFIQVRA